MWSEPSKLESKPSKVNIRNAKFYLGFGGISMDDMALGIQRLKKAWALVL